MRETSAGRTRLLCRTQIGFLVGRNSDRTTGSRVTTGSARRTVSSSADPFHLPPSAHHQSSPLSTNHNPFLSRPFHPLPIRPPKFASQSRTVNTFMWNDRHCSTPNFFICQTLQNANVKELADSAKTFDCNRSISLSSEHPSATVVSPGFPHMYPDNAFCLVEISAPPTHRLIIDFDELVIENESVCSYDYIELLEIEEDSDDDVGNSREGNRGNELAGEMTSSMAPKKLCGDWGDRLKLLRHESSSSRLRMLFVSDYSHHFPGFKARVSMVHAGLECSDDRMLMYNNSCYMVVSYPQVTWHTAKEICTGLRARLASVHSIEEESFIITRIRESKDYSTNTIYWLGATFEALGRWRWQDGSLLNFSAWLPNNVEDHNRLHGLNCLSIKWSPAPLQHLSNGLHMVPERCQLIGGYVCKRDVQVPGSSLNLNETINGTEGKLSSPNYPSPYYNDLDYYVQIESGESTRIVIQFESLDLEHQTECLYDFIELRSIAPDAEPVKFCGHHEPPFLNGLNFVSEKNKVLVRFHSDYSVSGFGFSASWHAVDVAGCPQQTLTAQQGVITSPNFPRFLLSHLDCTTTILAPAGKKVWLEILEYDMGFPDEDAFKEEKLKINVGADDTAFEPFQISHFLNDGAFLSYGEELRLHLKTGRSPQGRGFKAAYKVVDSVLSERIVDLSNTSRGYLLQLNYPASPPEDLDYSQHLTVPVGYVISLNAQKVVLLKNGSEEDTLCSDGDRSMIEIKDTYRSKNGTVWRLCAAKSQDPPLFSVNSFLNSIHIRQISQTTSKTYFNISVKTMRDTSYKHKLREVASESIETCTPNSCQNGGKCVDVNEEKKICQCSGHYTGMFCALTMCDLEPCLFGKCELSPSGFQCVCQPGYRGANCDIKNRPCADNPCEGRGECVERSETTFSCRCHAWWEGPRCERRLIHIPFKPLHQRMLQEPFWLGLITVFVVMGIIGTFWCCRRHLPEKLEKLLAEEADRNRRYANPSSCRVPSVRANLGQAVGSGVGSGGGAAGGATPNSAHAGAAPPRTIFDRLGIRKTSLLSLTSPLQTNRTFSLDDLLKHSPKRNNKLEKKVTFARLLSKVSTEISSGSEDTVQITKDPAADLAWTHSDGSAKGEPKRRPGRLSLDIGAPSKKAASADSIIAMFRNFSADAADAIQGSGGRFNSMMSVASTLSASTPQDDPSATPTGPWQGSDLSLSSALRSPTSSSNPPSPVLARRHSNTIQISVLEPHSAQTSSSLLHPPTILLEASNKCLSPIRELPTPAPSPALSPVFRRKNGDKESTGEETSIFLSVPTEYYTRLERRSSEGMTKQGKPSSLNVSIPTVTVEEPSPTGSLPTLRISPGSPPPRKEPFMSSKELLSPEEAATRGPDAGAGPPTITITYSMSEVESDSEAAGAGKGKAPSPGGGGMDYLSPFSVGTSRAEHASESNLSSSGYSTGPSRCGSNNPLCPSEPEDHPPRRPSPLLRTPTAAERARVACVMRQRSDSETLSDDFHLESNDEGFSTDHVTAHPAMADPEPEGSAAPVPPPRRSRPVNLERFSSTHKSKCFSSVESDLDCLRTPTQSARSAEDVFLDVSNRGPKLSPELGASPESPPGALSPSLSPLSDRRGDLSSSPHGRLSPSLAGRLAESDGMCDFGSDGKKQAGEKCRHRKRRRRNKGVGGSLAGTTFSLQNLLDVPGKRSCETYTLARSRQSPKRRSKARHIANSSTSSSSAESLSSLRFSRKSERGAKELREKSRTCEEGKTCLEAPVLNPRLKRSCSSSEKLYSYKSSSIMLENEASTEPLLATSSASSKNTGFFIVSPRGRTDQTYD
ncbi:unnamed protein product [Bemisia tabaci]|uniref:Cubilin n=1 Tax=Bemisia tabaci TaxID=7038 RepID=A0A9P0A4W8_BEMTA|nr:unnamed protein product [Bemisia tabaci]